MNYNVTFNNLDSALNVAKLYDMQHKAFLSVLDGKYKDARRTYKEIAKIGVEDFEAYKALPQIRYKNIPFKESVTFLFNILKYRIYRAFTKKTPEEKQLVRQYKEYLKTQTPEEIAKKRIDVVIPSWF